MSEQRVVLVVEDEPAIADLERGYLERDGFGVVLATTGRAALAELDRSRPAAVLLDVGLPDLSGIEVCRRMRERGDWTPILFVTARDDEVDRVVGLELGADDYVTKPFSPRELVARVRAVLRRGPAGVAGSARGAGVAGGAGLRGDAGVAGGPGGPGGPGGAGGAGVWDGATGVARGGGGAGPGAPGPAGPHGGGDRGDARPGYRPAGAETLQLGRLSVDRAARRVRVDGELCELTATEHDLLVHLLLARRRVCSREELLSEVWGYPAGTATRTVDVHVAQLRGKLGDAVVLRSVRGVGYALDPPTGHALSR